MRPKTLDEALWMYAMAVKYATDDLFGEARIRYARHEIDRFL